MNLDAPIDNKTPISYSLVLSVKAVTKVIITTALTITNQIMKLAYRFKVSKGFDNLLNSSLLASNVKNSGKLAL